MNIFEIIFWTIIFFFIFGVGLAPIITTGFYTAIGLGGLTGIEAFMYANFLLWILLIFIMAIFWWTQ